MNLRQRRKYIKYKQRLWQAVVKDDFRRASKMLRFVGDDDELLNAAIQSGQSAEMVELLLGGLKLQEDESTPYFCTYRYDVANALLNAGADPCAVNKEGATPLHSCTRPEIAELLIAAGAHMNAEDEHGRTPLDYAISHNHQSTRHKQLIATLIRDGATKGSRLPEH